MITISLNQIKAKEPCWDGWETILKARGGKSADYDEQFPLSFALDSNGLNDVLWSLRCLPEHNNLWRKYAVWCARQVEHLMTDQRSLDVLDVAWRHSDGLVTDDDLKSARDAARDAASAADDARDDTRASYAAKAAAWAADDARDAAWNAASAAAWNAAKAAAWAAALDDARDAAWAAAWAADDARETAIDAARNAGVAAAGNSGAALDAEKDAQTQKLREILDAGEWI